MIVSGLGTQLLVRRVSGDRLAAFVGGALFAVGAHRWHPPRAPARAGDDVPAAGALCAFDRFWQKRTLGRALVVGLMLGLQALSLDLPGRDHGAGPGGRDRALRSPGRARPPRDSLRPGSRAARSRRLVAAPVARPVPAHARVPGRRVDDRRRGDLRHDADVVRRVRLAALRRGHPAPPRSGADVQDTLFPGVVAAGARPRRPRRARPAATARSRSSASALAIVISLGPETAFYRFLHEHVVLVRGVRALSRFSLVPVLALSVLAGLALAGRRRLSRPAPWPCSSSSRRTRRSATTGGPGRPSGPPLAGRRAGPSSQLPLGAGDTQARCSTASRTGGRW